MSAFMLLVMLSVPGPDVGRTISYDVARLPLARALELEGRSALYRVAVASTAWEDGPEVSYDVEAPTGLHGTIHPPTLPIGHEYPDEFEVQGGLQVVRHPAREFNPAFCASLYLSAAFVVAPFFEQWYLAGDSLLVLLILWRLMDCGPPPKPGH